VATAAPFDRLAPVEVVSPDGTRIAYDVEGTGPPVVFLHGLTNRRQAWDPVTSRLRDRFTCVRIDARGHGESSTAPEYSLLSMVADVKAVVDEVALGEPALVGHSLGGPTAVIYAVANSARAVVCVDQTLRFGDFAARVRPHEERLHGDGWADAVIEIEHDLGLEPFDAIADLEQRVREFPREVILGVWAQLLATPPEDLTALAEAALPQCRAPLLAIHGSPPEPDYPEWLMSRVPKAELEIWAGQGHMLHLVDPDRFARRVERFATATLA
jgi:pimeloyl-ACP methyl ester carboxylesterase